MRNLSTKEGLIPLTVVSERHILVSALRHTLGLLCEIDSIPDLGQFSRDTHSADILILEQTRWTADAVRKAVQATSGGVIVWLPSISPEVALTSFEMGATAILGDRCSESEILQCVQAVNCGGSWVPEALNASLLTRRICKLTPREAELITLLASGLRNKEIAWSLGITEGTVKVYLSKIFTKLGVSDRFELALFALRSIGVLPARPDDRMADAHSPTQNVLQTMPRSVFLMRSNPRFTAAESSAPHYRMSA